ncbi:hypothetical protein GCM10027053_29370 [Intrasporangium mesophilum]
MTNPSVRVGTVTIGTLMRASLPAGIHRMPCGIRLRCNVVPSGDETPRPDHPKERVHGKHRPGASDADSRSVGPLPLHRLRTGLYGTE